MTNSSINPADYPRRILLVVSGLAPQVLTETLYALTQVELPAFHPTEIHLLTTQEGAERARLYLLSKDPGWYRRICDDYGLDSSAFRQENIHRLRNEQGGVLDDIRTDSENRQAADFILNRLRKLTEDPDSALHLSLAGGRKTMGFFAGYALSLFGRPQDRLSHVLVTPPYEDNPAFFYPTPESSIIYTQQPDSRPLDAKDAQVTLSDIPFVRMRETLPEAVTSGIYSYCDTVRAAQPQTDPPKLQVDLESRQMKLGNELIHLAPAEFAFYSWFALRRKAYKDPIHWTDEGLGAEYLKHYGQIVNPASGDYERVEHALTDGMTKDYFDMRKSRTNAALKEALGSRFADPYLIKPHGTRPRTRFGLTLLPEAITLDTIGEA
ncbi:MAG: TIGR02584 family CRISPR-associated protein [gamma proteobacterium endosymbiont of Lamellibrachia anaximandri]|nr:TIGR02584 family CRISPR-associated protein [gamma proteobacterium endosymbiont of Lamellibrachia anaximandri]MBL3535708.1 TIGR02584 family CRISPR-associated protein [gamma proteobacterium endosymbiont of Lamellibrachia anaximandri]